MIRVMTLNLAGMTKDWFKGRAERLCAGLTPLQPDVLCLQEVGIRGGPDFHHQVALIGEWLDLPTFAFAPYGNPEELVSTEQGGIAVLTRWPLLTVEERRLPPGKHPPDNRTAQLLMIQHPDGPLHLVNTHLSWRPDEQDVRVEQMVAILDRVQDEGWLAGGEHFVLAGDMNAPEGEPVFELLAHHLVDTFRENHPENPGYTWEPTNPYSGGYPSPSRRLDYIFVDRRAHVSASGRALYTPEWIASDHYAVWADLSWPPSEEAP
ncbi:MAG TPA: endonuclease/exonuclease/phosphatase family protein [Oscillatoriaceae cyanobacterium]